jgi:hypothetical protein
VLGWAPRSTAGRECDRGERSSRQRLCQPYVGAFFNFLLADEPVLGGWQSGLLWGNWKPKPSYAAFARAVVEIRRGWVDCSAVGGIS